MKNLRQIKDLIKNIANEKNINSQILLKNYMIHRLLKRIYLSEYSKFFIIKGGILITGIIGVQARTTVDLDTTINSFPINNDSLKSMFNEIFSTKTEDGIEFKLKKLDGIREESEYEGFRLSILALMGKARIPLKIDLTTGDKLTPAEINYSYQLLFEDKKIELLSYNLETLLAEKFETIVSRSLTNTRMRDFYDVYILAAEYKDKINMELLAVALTETAKNRGSYKSIKNGRQILIDIFNSDIILNHWNRYRNKFQYAKDIEFSSLKEEVMNLWGTIESVDK